MLSVTFLLYSFQWGEEERRGKVGGFRWGGRGPGQHPLPGSSVFIQPLSLLRVNNKLLLRAGAGGGGYSSPT